MRLSLSLTLSQLTILCSGQTALFLFLLAKAALAYLPTALSVALRASFFFSRPSILKFFRQGLRHSASSLLVSAAPTSLPLPFFSYLTLATLSSLPSFLLPHSLWQKLSSLSFCSIRLQWVPGHSFLPENDAVDELVRPGTLLVPSAIPCSLSPLISRIHSSLFSD